MAEKEISNLSEKEYSLISEAIYNLVCECPDIPIGVSLEYLEGTSEENITVYPSERDKTQQETYIDGGFSAKVDFQIAYKSYPDTDEQKLKRQKEMSKIMDWLSKTDELPLLTDGRIVTGIDLINSFATIDEKGKDGNVVFVSSATLTYRKKGIF